MVATIYGNIVKIFNHKIELQETKKVGEGRLVCQALFPLEYGTTADCPHSGGITWNRTRYPGISHTY